MRRRRAGFPLVRWACTFGKRICREIRHDRHFALASRIFLAAGPLRQMINRMNSVRFPIRWHWVIGWLSQVTLIPVVLAQVDWDWTWADPMPAPYPVTAVASDGKRTVALAREGVVLTREAPGEWSVHSTGVYDSEITSLIWTAEEFVGVGSGGRVITSSDGREWFTRASVTTERLTSVVWSGKILVAVGWNGTILTSRDGRRWEPRNQASGDFLSSVIWTGERFVVVGSGPAAGGGYRRFSMVSNDGITWDEHPIDSPVSFVDAAWTGAKVVAMGHNSDGADTIATSFDGITWMVETRPGWMQPAKVTWTGKLVVVLSEGGRIWTSRDGSNWTERFAKKGPVNFCWTGSEGIFLTLRGAFTTSDFIEWREDYRTVARDVHWNGALWAEDLWIITGSKGALATSSDGFNWTLRPTGTDATLYSCAWSGFRYVITGSYGMLLTSEDGKVWTQRPLPTTRTLLSVAWSGSQFIAVGPAGAYGSPDGIAWTLLNTASDFMEVIWTGKEFAAAKWGAVMTSADGVTWSGLRGMRNGHAIASKGSILIGTGQGIFGVSDEDQWEVPLDFGTLRGIAVAAGDFVAVGYGDLWSSTNGRRWRSHRGFRDTSFTAASWNGEQLLAVGAIGSIVVGRPRAFEGERRFEDWLNGAVMDEEDLSLALLRYGFGTTALFDGQLETPKMARSFGQPSLLFQRNLHREDLAFSIQVSPDLVTWETVATQSGAAGWRQLSPAVAVSEWSADSSGGLRHVQVDLLEEATEDNAGGFFRVGIQRAP